MCVFDRLRQENNYFKDFSDANEIERIAGEVRHQFELLDYPTPLRIFLIKWDLRYIKKTYQRIFLALLGLVIP